MKKFDSLTYILYESDMARCERIIKRQWILTIILVLALIASNVAWYFLT